MNVTKEKLKQVKKEIKKLMIRLYGEGVGCRLGIMLRVGSGVEKLDEYDSQNNRKNKATTLPFICLFCLIIFSLCI